MTVRFGCFLPPCSALIGCLQWAQPDWHLYVLLVSSSDRCCNENGYQTLHLNLNASLQTKNVKSRMWISTIIQSVNRNSATMLNYVLLTLAYWLTKAVVTVYCDCWLLLGLGVGWHCWNNKQLFRNESQISTELVNLLNWRGHERCDVTIHLGVASIRFSSIQGLITYWHLSAFGISRCRLLSVRVPWLQAESS